MNSGSMRREKPLTVGFVSVGVVALALLDEASMNFLVDLANEAVCVRTELDVNPKLSHRNGSDSSLIYIAFSPQILFANRPSRRSFCHP